MPLFAPTNSQAPAAKKRGLTVREITIFAMLGTVMFCSKIIMEALPNLHLLGMLIMVYTLVFRKKALIPIYCYVFLNGLYAGFSLWWVPYLYIWTILWGVTMLLPKNLPEKLPRELCIIIYSAVCALHGLAFGLLYAPAQALFFGLNFQEMLVWIAAGFSFDVIHALGNLFAGLLILPLSALLKRLSEKNA